MPTLTESPAGSGVNATQSLLPLQWLKSIAIVFSLIVGVGLTSTPAHSQGLFGVQESLHFITNTGVSGPDGRTLPLGYKVSMYLFGASWWVHDDGYVLLSPPKIHEYFPLSEADIAAYQRAGALPYPLPRYSLTPFEIVVGFSGWIAVVGAAIWFSGRRLWRRTQRASSVR